MTQENPSIVIFDLDGTITRHDTYVRFLLFSIYQQPLKILQLPMLAIDVLRHKLGRQTNTWLKKRFLRAVLAGQNRDIIIKRGHSFSRYVASKGVRQDAIAIIKSHQELGHDLVLLSASLDIYVELLGKLLGFKYIICTRTTWDNDVLASELDGGNCYGETKIQRLKIWLADRPGSSIRVAYGDHESDFPLLRLAQRGVVVNPDKKLRAKAALNQLEIVEWK